MVRIGFRSTKITKNFGLTVQRCGKDAWKSMAILWDPRSHFRNRECRISAIADLVLRRAAGGPQSGLECFQGLACTAASIPRTFVYTMALLSTESGDTGEPIEFVVELGETVIGRHPDCTIVVDAAAVSRRHARVVRTGDSYTVEDAGSRNGTFLNGQLLSGPKSLFNGDTIRISDVEFSFINDEIADSLPTSDRADFASASSNFAKHASQKRGFGGLGGNQPGDPHFDREKPASTLGSPNSNRLDGRPGEPGSIGQREMTFDGNAFGIMLVDDNADQKSSQIDFQSSVDGVKVVATAEAKLKALMRMNQYLGGALSLEEVLPNLLAGLFDIFPAADRGFVVMKSDDGTLVPRWVKTRKGVDDETIRISKTIVSHVMQNGEAILSFDAADDSRFDSSQSIADFSIRSLICAPLMDADGNAIGALQIDSIRGSGQFRNDDVDLLAAVAASAGVVINNAAMHEEVIKQREVQHDLQLATEVQKAFLPDRSPDIPGFSLASYYKAATYIGGDYYDYIDLSGGRVAVVVADVVGHGVAAAMFMAKLSAETRFCLASIDDHARAIEHLNDRMSKLAVDRFVTFAVVVIDPNADHVTIVNAGHMPPLLLKSGGDSVLEPGAEESGLPIAIDTGMDYESVRCVMSPGDVMVLYTDGVNEAMNAEDEEFGIERVRRLTAAGGGAEAVIARVVDGVHTFLGPTPAFDDMALVVIERLSPET